MPNHFLQVHTLTHFSASLLNRDDAGFAKRMPFGGAVRTRISSQCLKRHWRVYEGVNSLKTIEAPESVRSRVAFERYVVAPLVDQGVDGALARLATQKVVDNLFGSEAKKEKAANKKKGEKKASAPGKVTGAETVATAQVTVLGRPELEYLLRLTHEAIREAGGNADKIELVVGQRMKDKKLRENIRALKPGSLEAGLGAALFGRMVTGDVLSATDAAIHVSHAMTVHGHMTESDYFTAVDDLVREEGEQGSGHINASELTSGLFYGYVVVDLRTLLANLGGDTSLSGDVVHRLMHMVATVSPGAKKGSTAPYAYSHLVFAEAGTRQPRSLQNAFVEPVRATGNLVANAYSALQRHLLDLDAMYPKPPSEERAHARIGQGEEFEPFGPWMPLPGLADWARDQVASH